MTVIDHRYSPHRVWTCIGRPDDPHKSLVDENGGLLYGFRKDPARIETYRFSRRIDVRVQGDREIRERRQSIVSARVPIVITELVFDDQTLTLETAGHADADGRRSDVVRWTIRVHDDAPEPLLTGVWLQLQDAHRRFLPAGGARSRYVMSVDLEALPPVGSLMEMFQPRATVDVVPDEGTVALVSDRALEPTSAFDFGPSSALRHEPERVAPGGTLRGAFVLPLDAPAPATFTPADADAILASERTFWNELPSLDLPIRVGDPQIDDLLVASARNVLQAREVRNGRLEFQVGPTIYRGVWIVDSYFFLEAARFLGLDDDAAEGTEALMTRARDDGGIEEMDFHYKETGIALATLVRQSELAPDGAWVDRHWPLVRRAVGYLRRRIDESLALPSDAPNYGLLPASMADGGAGGMRPEYTTALWTWVGLQAVAKAARRLGRDDEGAAVLAADLLRRTLAGRERDLAVTDDGLRYWPQVMPGSGIHHWIADHDDVPGPWRALNAGSATWALAQAIHPGEAFARDHDVVRDFCALMDAIDDEEGVPAETGWLPYRAVWTYAASFSAQVWLYAGRPDKAVDYLYAFANHASTTWTWREEQSFRANRNGQVFGDMPHNWASVEAIRWVRNLLAFETTGTLTLLAGTPQRWLEGSGVRLDRSPTQYGRLTMDASLEHGTLTVHARLDPAGAVQAVGRIEVAAPFDADVRAIVVNGHAVQAGADLRDVVLVGP